MRVPSQLTTLRPAAVCLLVGAVLFTGCRSGWRASTPTEADLAAWAAEREVSETLLEKRARTHAHYAAGVAHDMNGRTDDATKEYWKAALGDPGNETLVIELAQRLLQQEQTEKAMDLLALSAGRTNASGQVHAWLAMAQAKAGKVDLAILSNRTAIKRAPNLVMAYQNLARIYLAKQQPAEALKVLDQAAAQPGASTPFLADLADFLCGAVRAKSLKLEDVKPRVTALLERAAAGKPELPLVVQKMAESYKTIGELGKATQLYEDLLKKHPQSMPGVAPLLREQLFQLHLRSGDRRAAADQLKAIIQDNPTDARAYYFLGALAAEEKDYAESAAHYQKAILLNEQLEPAYYDLASVQVASDKAQDALETLKRARARFPSNFALEFYAGVAYAALKQYTEAIKAYTAAEVGAAAKEPERLTHLFYFQVGAAFERNGNHEDAEKNLRKCLALSKDFSEALNYLGYMWAERGTNLTEALDMIERAVKAEPKNAAFLDSMAWVLFKLKRPAEALNYQEQAIALSEKPDAVLYDHLGDILAQLGRPDEALKAWSRSVEIEPNEAIKKKLDALPRQPTRPD